MTKTKTRLTLDLNREDYKKLVKISREKEIVKANVLRKGLKIVSAAEEGRIIICGVNGEKIPWDLIF